jgi:formylglycine-generating enzyme required for sulfatase activity
MTQRAAGLQSSQDLRELNAFRDVDAPWCPELVALTADLFRMGSAASDDQAREREKPDHLVSISHPFAIGRYPVTVGEYRCFCDDTGYSHQGGLSVWDGTSWKVDPSKSWRDPGFEQTDRHPVVGVSWHDTQAYLEWLGSELRQHYRLPSETEWEYACRAGTHTRYSFGDTVTPLDANYGGNIGGTTTVGCYPPNAWGLSDMHGNVWEWVEDVWHDSYEGAPVDGTAWTDGRTMEYVVRVLRGGAWGRSPRSLRSANRGRNRADLRDFYFGFRVARTSDAAIRSDRDRR